MDNKIFVSIASFMDLELYPTVERLLSQAKYPENIHVFVFSQNEDDGHPDLEPLFSQYGGKLNYTKINYRDTKGVCWVRAEILKKLNLDYKYYLQLDSHMAFENEWDEILISDYSLALEKHPQCIFTVYPGGYEYRNNLCLVNGQISIPRVPVYVPNALSKFRTAEIDNIRLKVFGKPYGNKTFWFSGNFAFGQSRHFIETPYDPNFFFDGEEHSMTLRMFSKNITFLSPPHTCIYHYYAKDKKIYVHDLTIFDTLIEKSNAYINSFFNFEITGEFGIQADTIYKWLIASRDAR